MKKVNIIVLVIWSFSTLAGIYMALSGGAFLDYFFPVVIGLSLLGTSYINHKGGFDQKK
ncbi:MAG: hypothetical protein ACI9DM_000264 [Cyclobacteriaceae bacterium]|jgi:hypothetical protein